MQQLKAIFSRNTLANKNVLLASATVAALALGTDAMAGTAGTEFDDIYTLLVGWTEGVLGKVIALGMFMVGLASGIVDQSIIAVVVGLSGALALTYGPGILGAIATALV